MKYVEWRQALSEELMALLTNGTWDLIPPSTTQNMVGCKWVFISNEILMGPFLAIKLDLLLKDSINDPALTFMRHLVR